MGWEICVLTIPPGDSTLHSGFGTAAARYPVSLAAQTPGIRTCPIVFIAVLLQVIESNQLIPLPLYSLVKVAQSCLDSLRPPGLHSPWNSPGHNTGVGSLFLLQGIFPIQESNPGPPHCRRILYHLSHMGSPKGSLPYPLLIAQQKYLEKLPKS